MNVSHIRSDFCLCDPSFSLLLVGLLCFLSDVFDHLKSLLDVLGGSLRLGLLQHLQEHLVSGLGGVLGQQNSHGSAGRVAGSERIVRGEAGVASMGHCSGVDVSSSEHMSDSSHDVVMSSDHGSVGGGETGLHETVSVHDSVKLLDLAVGAHGGVSNDAVQLVDESVVGNKRVHLVDLHL